MTMEWETDRLAALVQKKHECLLKLREFGERQLELVRSGGVTQLLEILAHKQRLLSVMQKLERAMDPFRGQDPAERQWRDESTRLTCAQRIDENARLLNEVMEQERTSEQEMRVRRDQAAADLKGMHNKNKVAGAYAAHSRQAPAGAGR